MNVINSCDLLVHNCVGGHTFTALLGLLAAGLWRLLLTLQQQPPQTSATPPPTPPAPKRRHSKLPVD
eukprot:COSAG02_NODE_25769_length_649_cov_1.310909_2_plen_66_part_01